MISLKDFLKRTNNGPVVRSSVPMGYGRGLPLLNIVGDRLLVTVFYYKSIPRPNDQTLLMPPEYLLSFDYPSGRLVSFEALRLSPRCKNVNFSRPVGTFRHDAIKNLNRDQYQAKKDELYAYVDKLIANLGDEGEFTDADEASLCELYGLLTEPSLIPAYRMAAPQFAARYIEQ